MFENDVTITGIHATYIKHLHDEAKIYNRYIDVYMNGAVFGLLYNRTAKRDTDSSDRARIYADAFANCRDECVFLYRLVMLLDNSTDLTMEQRLDRAFRDDASEDGAALEKNLELFNSYVLGGIEVLFERFDEGCTTEDDYITRLYERMKDFNEDISGMSYADKITAYL